ncbi:MAG: hypothetical protein ACRD3N_13915 [Terracidiphilus sp.]
MSVQIEPEDCPAAVRFHFEEKHSSFDVVCISVVAGQRQPYEINGPMHFANRDEFKAKVVEAGMSPSAAEDQNRSFNATARQLRELGFAVEMRPVERAS